MALSGSFHKTIATGYRLLAKWSASQDIANNKSTINLRLYWESLGSSYTVNSSATKSGYKMIDGSKGSFTDTASLSGNQTRQLADVYTKTVSHNADGTCKVDLEGTFNIALTLSGKYYADVTANDTVTLNTIPRASTLSSSASWTAGSNLSVSISRATSAFTHKVRIYVGGTHIKDLTDVGTSASSSFSATDNENIFKRINANTKATASTEIRLETYKGSTLIGTKSYTGTVTAPAASTVKSSTVADFNIGDPITVKLSTSNSAFSNTIKIYVNKSIVKTINGVKTETTWTPSAAEKTSMYSKTPDSNTAPTEIEVITYMGSTQVRNPSSVTGVAKVTNSNPSFTAALSYKDVNTKATGVTGNTLPNLPVLQKVSEVQVDLPSTSQATALNSATIKQYVATLNGEALTAKSPFTWPLIFKFKPINASKNVTLTVKAVDSRNNSTSVTKEVQVLPYSEPVVNASVSRVGNFENTTNIKLNGSISSVNGKNQVLSTEYRYRENKSGTSFTAWLPISRTTSGTAYTGVTTTVNLDNTKAYILEIKTVDKLTQTTVTKNVASGKPILFIDAINKLLGINAFPNTNYHGALQIDGGLRTNSGYLGMGPYDSTYGTGTAQFFWDGNSKTVRLMAKGGQGTKTDAFIPARFLVSGVIESEDHFKAPADQYFSSGTWGLDMNNSDIVGANTIAFNDVSNADSEGLIWLKSGKTSRSSNHGDYDWFRVMDGTGYLNQSPIFTSDDPQLFSSSGIYLNANQTVTCTKNINDCPNGWIIVWSRYDGSKGVNDNWQYHIIPRFINTAAGHRLPIYSTSGATYKYVYVDGNKLKGHSQNDSSANEKYMCLRYIYSF